MMQQSVKKGAGRAWLWAVLAVVVMTVIIVNRAEALQVWHTLRQGEPGWIVVAAALQCAFFVAYAALYQTAFASVDVPGQTRKFLPLWFASVFVNTVAPPLGFTVFLDDAVRRGYSGARATVGVGVVRFTDVLTFGLLLLLGFFLLSLRHALHLYHVLAAGVLAAVMLAWIVGVLLALRFPTRLQALLKGVETIWSRLPAPKPPENWAERTSSDLIAGVQVLFASPRRLVLPFVVAMTAHVIDIAGLAALFPAFHQPLQIDILLSGFGVGVLFWMVSLTPEGVGTVEGMMALTFSAQGVPVHSATAIALAFRGLTYYLPLLLGLFFVRSLARDSALPAKGAFTAPIG